MFVLHKRTIFIGVLSTIIFCLFISLIAKSDPEWVFNDKNDALWAYNDFVNVRKSHSNEWVMLIVLDAERAALTVSWNSNKSTMNKEALQLASDAIPLSFRDIGNSIKDTATNAAILAISYADEVSLKKALVSKTIEIQQNKVNVALRKEELDNEYRHYRDHVAVYNESVSESQRKTPNTIGDIPSDEIGVDTNLSVPCSNPMCETVYSASESGLSNIVYLSEHYHLETCTKEHVYYGWNHDRSEFMTGFSAPNGPYWNCPPEYSGCPGKYFHPKLCGGTCGEYKRYPTDITGWAPQRGYGPRASHYEPHWVLCNEHLKPSIFGFLAPQNCSYHYYSCAGVDSCMNATNHADVDDDTTTSTPNPTPDSTPDPSPSTPSYHACGVHETSVSGDHSLK